MWLPHPKHKYQEQRCWLQHFMLKLRYKVDLYKAAGEHVKHPLYLLE